MSWVLPVETLPAGEVVALAKRGGGGGALDAGVHVRLVVVAEVHHVVAPLHGPGQGLEADVVGAAVAADGEEFEVVPDLAPLLEGLVGRLHAPAGGGGVLEGGVDVAVLPGGVGVEEGGDLQAVFLAAGKAGVSHKSIFLPQTCTAV